MSDEDLPEVEEGIGELFKPLSEWKIVQRVSEATGIPAAKFADDFMTGYRSFVAAANPISDSMPAICDRLKVVLQHANVMDMSKEEAFACGASLGYVFVTATEIRTKIRSQEE